MFLDTDNDTELYGEDTEKDIEYVDTIIVSDIHLGSQVSRAGELIQLLKKFDFHRLILNGDVFDDLNFKRLKKQDWKFLSLIRKLSNPDNNKEVIWVIGNHDGVAETLSHLLGVEVVEEFIWTYGDKKMLALHGHQFDDFITEKPVITEVATRIYTGMQLLGGDKQALSRWVKKRSKSFIRIVEKIANDAIAYGTMKSADYVFCGHTHLPSIIKNDKIVYVNSGSWTDIPSTFITVDAEHGVRLRTCKNETLISHGETRDVNTYLSVDNIG